MRFEEVPGVLARVTDIAHGSFYRDLYKMGPDVPAVSVRSMEDWLRVPLLTKDDLLARSLERRIHIPLSEVDHLRPSSGTSGRGALFSPRTFLRGMEYRLSYHDFKKPLIAYGVPAMPHWHAEFQRVHGGPGRVLAFDPAQPAACARLMKATGADSMSLFAFHISLIAPHLQRLGATEQIRFIEIAGEACTRKLFDFIRETFPNATILPFYGSSEVEDSPIGMPCRAITGEEPLSLYHGKQSHYLELLDPDTMRILEPLVGVEGELVITAYPGEPAAFPLIRFRTGDTVRVIDEHCAKHGTWSFTVLGRTAMDFLKIPGGILRSDEIERVLRTIPDTVSDVFTLDCTEEQTPQGPRIRPVLAVELRTAVDLKGLADTIASALRVSPVLTYAQGMQMGRYGALECTVLTPTLGKKTKRLTFR